LWAFLNPMVDLLSLICNDNLMHRSTTIFKHTLQRVGAYFTALSAGILNRYNKGRLILVILLQTMSSFVTNNTKGNL